MGYDATTKYVITKNEGIDKWVHVLPNGAHEPLPYPLTMKAGEVGPIVAKAQPDKQIGFLAELFGPATKSFYGEIVWMQPGWGQ